jgi:hypothetical protein
VGQIESFSVSNTDGSSKTTITRTATGWQLGAHNLSADALRAQRDAVQKALAQNTPNEPSHAQTYVADGGPSVVYAANAKADPLDDTVTVGGTTPPWSREKGNDFIASVQAVLDMPPLGSAPPTP